MGQFVWGGQFTLVACYDDEATARRIADALEAGHPQERKRGRK